MGLTHPKLYLEHIPYLKLAGDLVSLGKNKLWLMDPAQPIRAHYSPGPGQVLLGWACDPRHHATQPWTFARTTASGVCGGLSVSLWWTWSWEDISSQMLGATTWGICLKVEPARGKKNQNMEENSNTHWLTFGAGIQRHLNLSLCLPFGFVSHLLPSFA